MGFVVVVLTFIVASLGGNTLFRASESASYATIGTSASSLTKWKGLSAEWKDRNNWDNGIPDSTMDAIISVGSSTGKFDPVVPVVSSGDTAFVGNLTVQSGGNLTFASPNGYLVVWGSEKIQNDGRITLGSGTLVFKKKITFMQGGTFDAGSGTLQFEGVSWQNKAGSTFDPGTSTVVFAGTTSQTITGDITFSNLQVLTEGSLTIDGSVTVTNDAYVSSSSTLSLQSGDSLIVEGTLENDGTVVGDGNVSAGTLLPVELSSMHAAAIGLTAEIRWTTATEIENMGFAIQRKKVSASSGAWSEVGFVPGAGTSSSPHEYTFTDARLDAGTYAYRIKQIDRDGSYRFYGSAEVEVGRVPAELTLTQNYPNPFNPTTEIEFSVPRDGHVSLAVYDAAGREVAQLYNGMASGATQIRTRLEASQLATGIYFSVLKFEDRRVSRKMLLMK